VRIVVAVVIAYALFGVPRTSYELCCFLHCDGEGPVRVETLGWPVAYWSRDAVPGDPDLLGPVRWTPLGFAIDALVLGLLLCAVAIVGAAVHKPARFELRARSPGCTKLPPCEPPRARADS
jgi:hypothetical protein